MRILFYNWVQFDDWKLRGGGVSVYLKNIISDLINRPNIEITFLSSGQHYSIFNRNQPFIEETKNIYSNNGVRSFRIVNSEVKAPAHDMFFDLDIALRSESTKNIFRKFLEKYGPFDVIHFNNVEGISMNVFELKSEFENTKFILTAHNYHILCPQIELYYNGKEICKDFCSGNKCVTCIGSHDKLNTLKKYQALGSFIEKRKLEGKPLGDFFFVTAQNMWHIFRNARDILRSIKWVFLTMFRKANTSKTENFPIRQFTLDKKIEYTPESVIYNLWRMNNLAIIDKYIDHVVAVSDVARNAFIFCGVKEDKISTIFNGMDYVNSLDGAKALWELKKPKDEGEKICVGFFGYPIPSKGLPLLLDALDEMDEDVLGKIELFIASRMDATIESKLNQLKCKISRISISDGYERSQVPELMSMIQLGVIPSQWLETYCQTAAELMAFGSPILVSDTVGISGLIKSNQFIFESGSKKDLKQKLEFLIAHPKKLDEFWDSAQMPDSIDAHVEQLLKVFGG